MTKKAIKLVLAFTAGYLTSKFFTHMAALDFIGDHRDGASIPQSWECNLRGVTGVSWPR